VTRLESDYYAHMRFDPEHTSRVLEHYVPMFSGKGPVLELGCGRGEFLGLLRAAGVEAVGVDCDEGMVEAARAAGHQVVLADAAEYLHQEPAFGPYGGVFCAHFLEHLTPDQIAHLLAGVRRVLAPGGRFVAVTPNPACYAVLSHDFWRDPTHVRFYDVPLLEFFCRQAGLDVEGSGTNPLNHPGPPPDYLSADPVVHPGFGNLVEKAAAKLPEALKHRVRKGRAEVDPHEAAWAYELAHLVKVLSDRLRETSEALRSLRQAHDKLVWGLYESNEIYVVAKAAG
jgi:SAM-dependent methyltransferase